MTERVRLGIFGVGRGPRETEKEKVTEKLIGALVKDLQICMIGPKE